VSLQEGPGRPGGSEKTAPPITVAVPEEIPLTSVRLRDVFAVSETKAQETCAGKRDLSQVAHDHDALFSGKREETSNVDNKPVCITDVQVREVGYIALDPGGPF
jgi:hypothetical protein